MIINLLLINIINKYYKLITLIKILNDYNLFFKVY